MKKTKIRILVVDDHFVVRMGLSGSINMEPDMAVVAEASSGEQALQLYSREAPDVVLMDLRLPGLSGTQTTAELCQRASDARVLVLSTYDGEEDIYHALRAGARGYLLKSVVRQELLEAIRIVHNGGRYVPAEVARKLAERLPRPELSAREMEVLRLVVKGLSNKEIAASLSITEVTVKLHVSNILSKLGVSDRTQATTAAIQRGLVHLE